MVMLQYFWNMSRQQTLINFQHCPALTECVAINLSMFPLISSNIKTELKGIQTIFFQKNVCVCVSL